VTTYKWHFEVVDNAKKHIRELPSKIRKAVFRGMRRILEADHPKGVPKVRKLEGENQAGEYRLKQGNYRIFFDVEPGKIVHEKTTYRGTIIFRAVKNRKDAYRKS